MNNINVIVSAVVWLIIISLMSIDWGELGKLVLIGGLIGGGGLFVLALISDETKSTKVANRDDSWAGVTEEPFGMQPSTFQQEQLETGTASLAIEKGLIIDEPWVGKILSGEKTWEMRSRKTPRRGPIALVKKGTKTVVGIAELYECEGPLSLEELKESQDKHCIPDSTLEGSDYKWNVAWKLKNIRELDKPVSYEHKSGATIWVTLDDRAKTLIPQLL